MTWIYNGTPIDRTFELIQSSTAFVYSIRHLETGREYIGQKRLKFVSHKRKKGRVRRIKVVKESDWETYWSSSSKLKADVERFGEHKFVREILCFCRSLSETNYYELKFQMDKDVLLHPDKFYNEFVGKRISRKQLGVKDE